MADVDEKKRPTNLFGKMLSRLQLERWRAKDKALEQMWERNGLKPGAKGYKIAETTSSYRDGTEVVEYRLYKLVDASVVTISGQVSSTIEDGISKLRENNR